MAASSTMQPIYTLLLAAAFSTDIFNDMFKVMLSSSTGIDTVSRQLLK